MDDFAWAAKKSGCNNEVKNKVAVRQGSTVLSAHILSWYQSKLKLTDLLASGKDPLPWLSNILQA